MDSSKKSLKSWDSPTTFNPKFRQADCRWKSSRRILKIWTRSESEGSHVCGSRPSQVLRQAWWNFMRRSKRRRKPFEEETVWRLLLGLWSISPVIEKHSILIESNCFNSVAMNYTQVLCTCTWRGIVLNSTMKFESSEVWGILKPHGGFRQCDCLFNPIQRHPTGETAGWMMMIWMSSMKMSWIRPMAGTCGSLGSCRILSILAKESHTKMNIQLTNLSGVRIRTSMVRGL